MDFARYEQEALYKIDLSGGQRRLKEAVLYVANKCYRLQFFGLIKLNKILWRADFRSFYERRQPVTGRQYQRQPLGPVAVEMPPVLNELLKDQLLIIEHRKQGNHVEQRPIPQTTPALHLFSLEDLAFLDESIDHYRDMTGTETSDESHGIAWRTRSDGDPMPYQSSYFEDRPLPTIRLEALAEKGRVAGWRSN